MSRRSMLLLALLFPTLAAGDSAEPPRGGPVLCAWHVPRLASSEVGVERVSARSRCWPQTAPLRAVLRCPPVPQGELTCVGRSRGQDGPGGWAASPARRRAGHGCRPWCRTAAAAVSLLQCSCSARAARAGPWVSSSVSRGPLPKPCQAEPQAGSGLGL